MHEDDMVIGNSKTEVIIWEEVGESGKQPQVIL